MSEDKFNKPIAWLDTRDNKVVVREDFYNGGHVRKDGAIPNNWMPLYLNAPPKVDVESLRMPEGDGTELGAAAIATTRNKGWNACLDHLASRGYFGLEPIDHRSMCLAVSDLTKALDNCRALIGRTVVLTVMPREQEHAYDTLKRHSETIVYANKYLAAMKGEG